MKSIHRKIWIVIGLLVIAVGISTLIYFRGGFSMLGEPEIGYCGNIDPPQHKGGTNANTGKQLFQANCTSCHSMDNVVVGPALRGVIGRIPHDDTFIRSLLLEPKQRLNKYSYALALSKQYGDKGHMSFKNILSEKDIDDIIDYLTPGYY